MNPTVKHNLVRAEDIAGYLPGAIFTTDAEGVITSYNDAAVALLGKKPEPGEKALWITSQLKDRQPTASQHLVLSRTDGSTTYLTSRGRLIFNEQGVLTGTINSLEDKTEAELLKIKNEELRESEERYHKMIEEVEDYAILLMDRDGFIQNWNAGAEKIKGYKAEEIIGKNFRLFYLPEDQQKQLPEILIEEAKRNGKALHEGWRVRKDGSRFWGSIVITALHNNDREIIGFSKVTRDLSEKKIAEDQIKKYAADLEFQNKELEQFAYAASHDLREPIRKIYFYNSYIEENFSPSLNERGKDYISRSLNACKRMQQLIEDLLSYTKTTSVIEQYQNVDISGIIKDIIALHKDELEANNVNMDIGVLPVIRAVPFQMKQLFENLISNSIKYRHPDRPCNIVIRSDKVKGAEIKAGELNDERWYVNISVTDNGTGFEQAHADKIFELFQRLHSRSHSTGSGIGLAICKRIVQNHDGLITAKGVLNEGARFDTYFPIN